MLKVDSVIHKHRSFDIDSSSSNYAGLEQKTLLGACSVEQCSEDEALLEVKILAPSEYDADFPDFQWLLSHQLDDRDVFEDSLASSSSSFDETAAIPDTLYQTMECVPSDQCGAVFAFTAGFPAQFYSVKRNGVEISERSQVKDDLWGTKGNVELTPFGEECPVPGNSNGKEDDGAQDTGKEDGSENGGTGNTSKEDGNESDGAGSTSKEDVNGGNAMSENNDSGASSNKGNESNGVDGGAASSSGRGTIANLVICGIVSASAACVGL